MWDKPAALQRCTTLLLMVAIGMLLYAAALKIMHTGWFALKEIEVKGELMHVTAEQVEYVVRHELKGNFLTVKVSSIRDAFDKLPWVKAVAVHRRWPDKLDVVLTEHQALARWGESGLLDQEGIHFEAASNESLPILEGPRGTEQEMVKAYRRFKEIFSSIEKTPTHIWLSSRRAWKVALDKNMIVEIGRDYVDERLSRFVNVYHHTLAKLHQHEVNYVDLRYSNGFAVKLPRFQSLEKQV